MQAPGAPGAAPAWGPGCKQGFGTAATPESRVWFTIADGSLSDVFHPRIDSPLLHQLRFLAAAPGAPPLDLAADARHTVTWLEPGVPSFKVESRHPECLLRTEYVTDPSRDVLLISGSFEPQLPDLSLFVLASLHLVPGGPGNDAQVLPLDPPLLLGRQGETWVALLGPFARASVGFLNASDVFVDLHDNDGVMSWQHDEATGGNAAFGARLGIRSGGFQLVLGFGRSAAEAEDLARTAREEGFARIQRRFAEGWLRRLDLPRAFSQVSGDRGSLARASAAVLLSLEDKTSPGAFVAAPCAPWGETCQDGDHVYHLVWPRDLFQIGSALLNAGDHAAAQRALRFLVQTQKMDGSWPQNCSTQGVPHWRTPELDETAYPILLAWQLKAAGVLDIDAWPMVRRAALNLLTSGPSAALDRWEDAGGLSPSTLAAAIAALLAAAELAADTADAGAAAHLRTVADYWNARLEHWCLARPGGFYARLADDPDEGVGPEAVIAVEFVELVRRGLRRPDDPNVLSSLRAVDGLLKADTPSGPAWRRYAGDRYGERSDGTPWNGAGQGRAWPVLLGERAQLDLAAGRQAVEALAAFEAFAGPELLLPEQVWDAEPIPGRGLEPGRPTGSARPLGWAHAEYLKLLAAVATASAPDRVEPAWRRYVENAGPDAPLVWHHRHRIRTVPPGGRLLVQLPEAARLIWTGDDWATNAAVPTEPVGLGLHAGELPTEIMRPGARMEWTVRYPSRWEGVNYTVACVEPGD